MYPDRSSFVETKLDPAQTDVKQTPVTPIRAMDQREPTTIVIRLNQNGTARRNALPEYKEQPDGPLAQRGRCAQAQDAVPQSRQTRCHRMILAEIKDIRKTRDLAYLLFQDRRSGFATVFIPLQADLGE